MSETKRIIYVHANWVGIDTPMLIGRLYCSPHRNKEVYRFEYDDTWLHGPNVFQFDPELSLYSGPLHKTDGSNYNFRSFLDSCPDRWGKTLLQRREAIVARKEDRKPKTLLDSDYLLGVHDKYRMGGLRFSLDLLGPFLDDNDGMAAPPMSSIKELAYASQRIVEDDNTQDDETLKWLKLLIVPGGSLGGARPKASVTEKDGSEWIAKFPGKNDEIDIAAWEYMTYQLAQKAGIYMSECRLERFEHEHHTFITKRFDRIPQGRLHFSSALTQLEKYDGDGDSSYLELAEFITDNGVNAKEDLRQLWRRIIFNIAVSNTDDHLRNHGFILSSQRGASGWLLSPAYDINPSIDKSGLHLNITEHNNSLDYQLAFEVAELFQLSAEHAQKIYDEVLHSVSKWQSLATNLKISRADQQLMRGAFNV
ncbi:HipA-like protein [Paraglaciecola arctica BSs20135]|uniref:HipA-like protein n=2 Tax=Paraglaciecola TaxID=1621534 RepID=K6XLX8_9ALTE|nr:HipA domain-containing protein [Paraglaciecola arctica]GAC21669.1 HipA-like protein [Paraglaciecola arctica BSs20135]